MDVDLGLAIAILDQHRYHELCERLRSAGFEPDVNEVGQATNQRWRIESDNQYITVDFLIPPTLESDQGGRLRNLEDDGITDVFRRLRPLLANRTAKEALTILENDFAGVDRLGAMRVAEFFGDPLDDAIRADAAGAVRSLLGICHMHRTG